MDYLMTEISRLRNNKGNNNYNSQISMTNINVDISNSSLIDESLSDDDDTSENDDDDDSSNDTTATNDNDEEMDSTNKPLVLNKDMSLTKKDSGEGTNEVQSAKSSYPLVDIEPRESGSPIDVMTQTEQHTEKTTSSDELILTNHFNEAAPASTIAIMTVYKSICSRRNMTLHHVQQYQRYVERRSRLVCRQAEINKQ